MAKTPTQINIDLDEPNYRGEKRKRYEALVELRDQLIEDVSMLSGENLGVEHNAGEDMADIGSDNFSREIGLNVASEEGKKIFLINDALRRLANGTYGKCIDCSKVVGSGRLDAIPYAKLCITCKAEREESEFDGSTVSFGIDKEEELTE
ncbi:MAG: TraR/DksA family transcriptional regulator [Lentisphaeraceae bacterium]|nr:TraR/DksA family transcriptional regulator [Lentisphaeraceae bacterium]